MLIESIKEYVNHTYECSKRIQIFCIVAYSAIIVTQGYEVIRFWF